MGAYEIIIFGNLEFANSIMMGVARLANNASGAGLEYAAASIFFLAILLAFIRYYMNPERTSHPGKEFFLGIVLFLLFVSSEVSPKVDVILTSPYGFDVDYAGPPSYYIEDVPIIAALPAWVTTNLFHGIKETVKQEFVSPNYDGTFSANEVLSALVRLHDNGYSAVTLDHNVDTAVQEYINQCVIPFASLDQGGSAFVNTITNSRIEELWTNMRVTWDVPTVEHTLGPGGTTVTEDCPNAHTTIGNVIGDDSSEFGMGLKQHFHQARVTENNLYFANRLLFDNPIANPYSLMVSGYLTYTLGETLSDSSLAHWSNLMVFEGQRQRAYQRAGEASLWLNIMIPTITAIETFAFYIAPFVVIMAMAGSYGFKMIIGYLTLVVYINMWGFVQIFTDWYTVSTVTAAFSDSNLSLQNFTSSVVEIESYLSTAAALTASIPMLSTMLLYGGVHSLMGVMRNMTAGNVDASRPAPSVAQSLNNGAGGMANMQGAYNMDTGLWNQGRSSVSDNATVSMELNAQTAGGYSAASTEITQNTMSALNSQTEAFRSEVGSAFSELKASRASGSESFNRTDEASMVARLAEDFQQTLGVDDTQAQRLAIASYLQGAAGINLGIGKFGESGGARASGQVGARLQASVEGAILNRFGISEKDLESIQQSTGESEKFNEVWQRAQENAQQWNNTNSEASSTIAQSVLQWNDSYSQAQQMSATATQLQSMGIGMRLDSVSANSVLSHPGGGQGSFYDDMFNEVKGMYLNLNNGDEQAAMAQMRSELGIGGAGDIRRLGADGQGRVNAVNALGQLIGQVQQGAIQSGDAHQISASKAAIAGIFDKAAGRAGQLNDSNVETYFGRMRDAMTGENLSGAAQNAVNTASATGPDMQGRTREDVANTSASTVNRSAPEGDFRDPADINRNIDSGRDRVQEARSNMFERLDRSNMSLYAFADPVSGWDKLANPRDDIESQSMFNLGRLWNNMTNNIDTKGVDTGTAFGDAVRSELREQGIGNADAVGRGITTLMNESPERITQIANSAANGDRQALSQLMDIRAAQMFMATQPGAGLISSALQNIDDTNGNRFIGNVGESAGALQTYNDTARGLEGMGLQAIDNVIARSDTGSENALTRGAALNAIQFTKGMELASNTTAMQTASMAANGQFGEELGAKALGVSQLPESQGERNSVRDEAVRNYLREHDSGVHSGGINATMTGEDAINQRMRDIDRQMTNRSQFDSQVRDPAVSQFFNLVAGTSPDVSVRNANENDKARMASIQGAAGGTIDGIKAMSQLGELANLELTKSGGSYNGVTSTYGRTANQDAINLARDYGDELRGMVRQMEQSATTDDAANRAAAYGRALDNLELAAIQTPGNATQLPAEVGQAIREGNAPQTIEARGQTFNLEGFKENMAIYSGGSGDGSFYVATGENSRTDMLRYSQTPITPTRAAEDNATNQTQNSGNDMVDNSAGVNQEQRQFQDDSNVVGDPGLRHFVSPEIQPGSFDMSGFSDYGAAMAYKVNFGWGSAVPATPAGSGNTEEAVKPDQAPTTENTSAPVGDTAKQPDSVTNENAATQAGSMAPVTDNPAPAAPIQQPSPATPAGSGNAEEAAKPEQAPTTENTSAPVGDTAKQPDSVTNENAATQAGSMAPVTDNPAPAAPIQQPSLATPAGSGNTEEAAKPDQAPTTENTSAPVGDTAKQPDSVTNENAATQAGSMAPVTDNPAPAAPIQQPSPATPAGSGNAEEAAKPEQASGDAQGDTLRNTSGAEVIMVDGQEFSSTSITTPEGESVYEDLAGSQVVYDPQTSTVSPYAEQGEASAESRGSTIASGDDLVTKASSQGGGDKFVPLSKRDVMEMDDMALSDLRSGLIPETLEVGTSTLSYAGVFGTPEDPMGHIYTDEMGNAYYNSGYDGVIKPFGDIEDVEYTPMKPPKL